VIALTPKRPCEWCWPGWSRRDFSRRFCPSGGNRILARQFGDHAPWIAEQNPLTIWPPH